MENLDINVAIDIVLRAGRDLFTDIGGLLGTSKFCRDLASNGTVLRNISLSYLFSNAQFINIHSPYRVFFGRCLEAGNPTASYLESLRLAAREGRAEVALGILEGLHNGPPHALFGKGLLQLCLGYYDAAMLTINTFVDDVGSFYEADAIGSSVFRQIMQIGPRKIRPHTDTWNYVHIPDCVGCGISNRCPNCFFYWFSIMYLLLC